MQPSSDVAHHRARIAALSRSRPPDDPDLVAERRALAARRLKEHAERVVAAWPTPTPEQLAEVVGVLKLAGPDRKSVVAARIAELDGGASE